jgi:DNA mismatch endonuclease (patch repair protein)
MAKIRSTDTGPEMAVRRLVHGMGYRYRLHRKELPGNPDLVFKKRYKVIFVHGCFWHMHENCKRGNRPKSNRQYWNKKLFKNVERDKKNQARLKELGWDVLVIWECEVKDLEATALKIANFLEDNDERAQNRQHTD